MRLVLCNVSLLIFLFVIIATLFLIARAAARVAFVIFGHSILFRVHEAVHVISNLRLEVCDNSASCGVAEMVSLQELCNVCRISIKKPVGNFLNIDAPFRDGKARQGGYRRHFGRSLPSGFPTQILHTRWTLFSNLFFFLAFDFRRFSFFLLPLLMRSLCRPLKMLRKLSLLSSSVSVSRVTFCTLASRRT